MRASSIAWRGALVGDVAEVDEDVGDEAAGAAAGHAAGSGPGVPPLSGSSAGAVESPESGTGRRWLGNSRESMLIASRVIVGVGPL